MWLREWSSQSKQIRQRSWENNSKRVNHFCNLKFWNALFPFVDVKNVSLAADQFD